MTAMPRRTNKGAILTELIRSVFPLNGRLLEAGDRISSKVGLSSALWQVLGAINDNPRTVPQIGRIMGLARQSVQRSVNILESDGLVELVANPDHKTSPIVQLTAKGENAFSEVMKIQIDWSNNLATTFRTKDLQVAVAVLESFKEALENGE